MSTMTAAQAHRINARTAATVARLRNEADEMEAAGPADEIIAGMTRAILVAATRENADSLERAASRAIPGARISRA